MTMIERDTGGARPGNPASTYLLVPILLIAVLLSTAVIRGPSLVSLSGFGSAILVAAPLVMATFSLTSLAVAGRGTIDLAVGPLTAFINVSLVKLYALGVISQPFSFFVVAIGIGIIYQVAFALLILFVRIQPIIVALSGFLALTGINLVILPRPGGSTPDWMASWGLGSTLFSPILLIIVLATAGWLLFTLTPFYANLRLMGYDERAAFASGVRIYLVRIGAHVIAGIFVGLGGICYTALIASGDPTQGTTLTLTSVTAMVLGGVSLSGGRGGATGALLGALNLFLIGYVLSTFDFGSIQAYVTQLFYGLILVLSLLLTLLVPVVARYVAFISPYGAFVVLGVIVVGIMLQVSTHDTYVPPDSAATVAVTKDLLSRYLVLPQPGGTVAAGLSLTHTQAWALGIAAALVMLVVAARTMTVEATSLRLGTFLYIVIGALIVLSLLMAGELGHARAASSGMVAP